VILPLVPFPLVRKDLHIPWLVSGPTCNPSSFGLWHDDDVILLITLCPISLQVMQQSSSEAEAVETCAPLLAQLARSIAVGCLARILGASCQNKIAKAELLSLHGAHLVPLLLRAVSSGPKAGLESLQTAEAMTGLKSPASEDTTALAPDRVQIVESGMGGAGKKAPNLFSLSNMTCGFLPNLLSVSRPAKGAPSDLALPGTSKGCKLEAGPELHTEFELVDNCPSDKITHHVQSHVNSVKSQQDVDSVNSSDSTPPPLKLKAIVTRGAAAPVLSSAKIPNPSPAKEKELPETVMAAARCLAFLGYRPFPLWQATEAPKEEARDREVDDFVVVELEKETRDVWDQVWPLVLILYPERLPSFLRCF
jgi:hypothetical protein